MDPEPDSESTATDDGNTENFCDNPTRDILADGIISMFRPCVDQLQERVKATRIAQYELKQLLENLNMKLKAIEKSQQTPVILDEYLKKMINVKHKVTVVYNVLNNAQDRLNSIYKQIENEKIKGRALLNEEGEGR